MSTFVSNFKDLQENEKSLLSQEKTLEYAGQELKLEKNKNKGDIEEYQNEVKQLKYKEDIYKLAKKRLKKKIEEQHLKTIQGKLKEEDVKLKQENTIYNIITNTKNLIYGNEVSRQAEHATSYFLLSFTISILLFVAFWFLSVKITSVKETFNSIFCKKNSY